MGVFLVAVAAHLGGQYAARLQLVIQKDARAAAALAVDEGNVLAQEVFEGGDALGIAGQDDEALFAVGQMHQQGRRALQMVAHGLPVVFARSLVQQVRTGKVALPARKGQKAAQRAHVRRREAEARMRAAEQAVDDVQRIVVAADDEQGAFHLFPTADEFGAHRLSGVEAFAVTRNANHGVGAGKAGHGPGTPGEGNGVAGIAHHAEAHADAFFHARARGQGVAGNDVHVFLMAQAALLPQGEERQDEFLHGHDGRNGVARRADDGDHAFPGADDAQRRGLAGHDGDAVYAELAKGADDLGGVVV